MNQNKLEELFTHTSKVLKMSDIDVSEKFIKKVVNTFITVAVNSYGDDTIEEIIQEILKDNISVNDQQFYNILKLTIDDIFNPVTSITQYECERLSVGNYITFDDTRDRWSPLARELELDNLIVYGYITHRWTLRLSPEFLKQLKLATLRLSSNPDKKEIYKLAIQETRNKEGK